MLAKMTSKNQLTQLVAAGRATLVTGDRDLLVLAGSASFDIVSIEDFLAGLDPAVK